jgi:extracellular elastinolytic metalloproteinase
MDNPRMAIPAKFTQILSVSALSLTACTSGTDAPQAAMDRDQAVHELQRISGAPVAIEVGATGDARVLAMTPRFPVPGHAADPVAVAQDFVATHHDALQLAAADASQFVVTRVDTDRAGDIRHVTLQRVYNGIPVFQGAITVHMDAGNGVFRVLGDESYHIAAPTNRTVLAPAEAVAAAGRALGVTLSPTLTESAGQRAVFESPGALDPIHVDPQIFHVADGDDRFAYQTTVSWLDDQKQQQYQLAMIDAQDGSLLASYSLVESFTGRVFNVNAQPTATQSTDTRTVVSFDGDPAASPSGWVGAARNTVGNNAVAATDLDGNNAVGANETQPVPNASNSFDFPYSATQDASNFKAAAVANAFFLVNDYHDRTYRLGFTETAGNFQTSNFGKGGAQNDPVNVDAQDGSGTNNANFSTPPDGSRPRMQMFLFSLKNGAGGVRQDGDFDPSVIYHENTHGLSNRLVGGGTTRCLGGLQPGGMGEGWGDFMGSSFLNNPVVGAYVTGNATKGIRTAPMSNSPWTYNDVKIGTLNEVHKVGELWAAVLWDVRKVVGGPKTEQLVVSGMKLTPCNPSMLNARDAIISADTNINAGANKCAIWRAFAGRLMGTGAVSSTTASQIVTSTAVPAGC